MIHQREDYNGIIDTKGKIGEDEPVSAGVEEDEVKINEKDLPF